MTGGLYPNNCVSQSPRPVEKGVGCPALLSPSARCAPHTPTSPAPPAPGFIPVCLPTPSNKQPLAAPCSCSPLSPCRLPELLQVVKHCITGLPKDYTWYK